MKKIVLILLMVLLVGCAPLKSEKAKIIVPNGTTYLGIGTLKNNDKYHIENVDGAIALKTAFVNNEYDIIIAPLNLGAQLFVKKNSDYKLSAIITLGNNYIISKKPLNNISELQGKTILGFGEANTPDIVLKKALLTNNIAAKIEYQNSINEVVPLFIQGKYEYALAAEPVITKIKEDKKIELYVLNLNEYVDFSVFQAGIFVKDNSLINIEKVLKDIKNNIKYMNNNPKDYAKEIVGLDVYFTDLGENIISKSIPQSNIVFMEAKSNVEDIERYLEEIGYEKPERDFYR